MQASLQCSAPTVQETVTNLQYITGETKDSVYNTYVQYSSQMAPVLWIRIDVFRILTFNSFRSWSRSGPDPKLGKLKKNEFEVQGKGFSKDYFTVTIDEFDLFKVKRIA